MKHLLVLILLCSGAALADPLTELQHLGPLYIAMPESLVLKALGPPDARSPKERDATSGWRFETLTYRSKGLKVRLTEQDKAQGFKIWGVTAGDRCQLKTSRSIAIGSPRSDVTDAYQDRIDRKASSEGQVVAGKSDDGLVFDMKAGRVAAIHFGPGAP